MTSWPRIPTGIGQPLNGNIAAVARVRWPSPHPIFVADKMQYRGTLCLEPRGQSQSTVTSLP